MCGQRFRYVSYDFQTLQTDVTCIGEMAQLYWPRDRNAESRSPRQVYCIFHLECGREEPHGDTVTHRTGEMRLQGTAHVNV